ncbi:hypothetical protein ACM16X_02630 [Haloarcula japonica]|uniref:hypothetical protein n=1 Tax=Haloarcula japonica TaxID=29282 RepID=UPI0039F6A3F9
MSNEIESDLKTQLDIGVACTDYNQRTVLSALIEAGLDDENGQISVDENLEPYLEKWDSHYNGDESAGEK